MYQSDQINELATALAKAQGEITPALKDKKNPFLKSNYADLSSVMAACKEPLSKHGLAVLQTMDSKDGQILLITTLVHESGQWMKSFLPVLCEKTTAQELGKAITYMRRYALSAMVGVTAEDDDGHSASHSSKSETQQNEKKSNTITSAEAYTLAVLTSDCPPEIQYNIKKHYREEYNVHKWEDLPKDLYGPLVTNLKNKAAVRAGGVGV